ncbi:MAG: SCP2 sterol-binding domain-containing protein [Promethearchaeota archaeon]
MSNPLHQLIDGLVTRVNRTPELREFVRNWVGSYHGKILQLETEKGTHHLILTTDGTIRVNKGSYPSPDVIYKAPAQTLLDLFTGQANFRELIKRWELVIIGAAHESVPLAKLIIQAMTTA